MKTIFSLFFLTTTFFYSHSQNYQGIITYKAISNSDNYILNLSNDSTKTEKIRKDLIKLFSSGKPVNFHLYIKGNEALFRPVVSHENMISTNSGMNVTGVLAGEHSLFYANLKTKERIFQYQRTSNILVNLSEIDWELTNEKKEIGDFVCYKAQGSFSSERFGFKILKPFIAWYASEISVPFGIAGFDGLPGLMLELIIEYEYGELKYSATQINFEPLEDVHIEKPVGRQTMSEKEYGHYVNKKRSSF
ncbi:GLPGLI family protein [Muricauda sp. SCSIO 64092]|uniref:GLPGLI family protein n=1 Tax=Allomuricauda sp. SCSIO 64092 TaxID=2908842 RepID=UPI001FF38181|nr:GLPGLI family protein [Muricauda sp. SCSIO 64092]UOY04901.1 GLPGLI family protein [Muricauda sp. SCSIO 64092]